MAMPDRNGGGALAGVRLTSVPIKTRRFYGRVLLDRAIKEMDPMAVVDFAVELHAAVEHPSDRLYLVPEAAVEDAKGKATWR